MPLRCIVFLLALPVIAGVQLPAVRATVEKRTLASRLLRSADGHKQRSLRDVLSEHPSQQPHQPHQSRQSRQSRQSHQSHQAEPQSEAERKAFRTMSELFAWAIQHTTGNYSLSLNTETHSSMLAPDSPKQLPSPRKLPSAKKLPARPVKVETKRAEATTEFDILKHSLHVLRMSSPGRQIRALQTVEELCHSIDNGCDLHITGGIPVLVHALESSHSAVRANAAWALATCSQNNPVVQNASLEAGAIPRLSYLAARDRSVVVRAKALFALNTVLEFESARETFEKLPMAIHAIRKALFDDQDTRATRRALNLTELLARRNLDAWKTSLEAWDIPGLVERILRAHPDGDVRESAARTIAALDGRAVP